MEKPDQQLDPLIFEAEHLNAEEQDQAGEMV